jgi:hypothetical protein
MGIAGLFPYLANHGLSPAAIDVQTFLEGIGSPAHLDLFGAFWHDIRSRMIDTKQNNGNIEDIGHRLALELKSLFGTTNIIAHVDGAPCVEKEKARELRTQKRLLHESILDDQVKALEKIPPTGSGRPGES